MWVLKLNCCKLRNPYKTLEEKEKKKLMEEFFTKI